jgi:hypothetical protein
MTSIRIPLITAAVLACGLAQPATSPRDPDPASFSALSAPAMTDARVVTPLSDGPPREDDAQALLADAALFSALQSLGLLAPEFALDADLALVTEAYAALRLNGASEAHEALDASMLHDSGHAPAYWAVPMPNRTLTAAAPEMDLLETGSDAVMYWDADENRDDVFATRAARITFLGKRLSRASITLNPDVDLLVTDVGDAASAPVYSLVSAVPEPASSVLMLVGLGWIGRVLVRHRRRVP